MPGDTPTPKCPTCGSADAPRVCCPGTHAPDDHDATCEPCWDEWHKRPAPTPFDAALAALDVEPTHHTDRMVTTYDILGLDAVRAAHRAEVDALSARVAKLEAEQSEARNRAARLEAALRFILSRNDFNLTDGAKVMARAALEEKS